MSDRGADKGRGAAVQTTGHAWDGDLQEFNNPLPRWWLWAFYGTVVFAVVYWFLYPAWPVGRDYTKGVLNRVTFQAGGETVTTHWNTRARLMRELQDSPAARRQRQYLEKVAAAGYDEILADPDMKGFAWSMAKGVYGDNCAPCHGSDGKGRIGLFPNLADDAWLWGGTVEDIETSIREGRQGFMPAFGEALSERQLDDVAAFVLSLSGHEVDPEAAARGARIFRGETGGCHYCHTREGTGLKSQGAADLTDRIWTVADVPGRPTLAGKKEEVKRVVRDGIRRTMPAWKDRLDPVQIKLLTVYVHELGGGR